MDGVTEGVGLREGVGVEEGWLPARGSCASSTRASRALRRAIGGRAGAVKLAVRGAKAEREVDQAIGRSACLPVGFGSEKPTAMFFLLED